MSDWQYIDAPKSLGRTGRIIVWVVVLLLLGSVVTGVLVIGDGYVRDAASGAVRSAVANALELEEGQDVEIEVGGGLVIVQALSGRVDEVTATVPEFTVEGGTASLRLTVTGIPIPPSGPVEGVRAVVSLDGAQLLVLQSRLSAVPLTDVRFVDGQVAVSSDVLVGDAAVPATVLLTPSVVEGAVVFTPTTVTLGETTDTAEAFLAGQFGPVVAPLLTPQSLCAAAFVPQAFSVDAVEVVGDALVITSTGSNVQLLGSGFRSKGSCTTG